MLRGGWAVVAGIALGIGAPGVREAGAQELALAGGAATYDLSGVGTSWSAAARYAHPVGPRLAMEVGVGVFGYGGDRFFLLPELGAAASIPAGPLSLRLSLGGGLFAPLEGRDETEPTLFAALDADLPASGRVSLRPGVRYRAVDPWAGTIFEFNLGVRIRLDR